MGQENRSYQSGLWNEAEQEMIHRRAHRDRREIHVLGLPSACSAPAPDLDPGASEPALDFDPGNSAVNSYALAA